MTLIIPPKSDSIWSSFEFKCISMDFPHSEYLAMHKSSNREAAPASATMYKALERVFFDEMAASYG